MRKKKFQAPRVPSDETAVRAAFIDLYTYGAGALHGRLVDGVPVLERADPFWGPTVEQLVRATHGPDGRDLFADIHRRAREMPYAEVQWPRGSRTSKARRWWGRSLVSDPVKRTATGTYTIHVDEATWAPVDGAPKEAAYEGAPSPLKNRRRRRTEAALARRVR